MRSYSIRSVAVGVLLGWVLAIAGCSAGDLDGLLSEPTNAPQAPAAQAPAQQAPAQQSPAQQAPAAGVAQPVAQQQPSPVPEQALQELSAEEAVISNVYARVSPAVVRISTGQGIGSGYLIDPDGHVVTNNHVIENSQNGQVIVSFSGLFATLGQVIGTDPDSDIAVVRVEQIPEGVVPVELGDSAQVRIGQLAIAIGNPLEQDRTVTTGIVSAIGRTIAEQPGSYSIGGAIQTDAAINPGNSGGPLLDSRGRVIGMNTAILSRSGTSSGIGFAVPVNLVKKVVPSLIERGQYEHPFLGVGLQTVTTFAAQQNNLPSAGVLIEARPGGPVAQAGLDGQAILTAINGELMTSDADVISYLSLNTSPGDTVTLTIVTAPGQQEDIQVQLGSRPQVEDEQQEEPSFPGLPFP
jgi:2-alkenal reductase